MSPGRGEFLLVSAGGYPLNTAPDDGHDAHKSACYKKNGQSVAEDFFYSSCPRFWEVGGGVDGCIADLERKKIHNSRILKYLILGKGIGKFQSSR